MDVLSLYMVFKAMRLDVAFWELRADRGEKIQRLSLVPWVFRVRASGRGDWNRAALGKDGGGEKRSCVPEDKQRKDFREGVTSAFQCCP